MRNIFCAVAVVVSIVSCAPKHSMTSPASSLSVPFSRETVYPVTSGAGPISSDTIEKYQKVAVFKFLDAPGAPTSGTIVAGIAASQLNIRGFTVVERSRLEQIFSEQQIQLMHADETSHALNVGRIAGAQAVVVGEVTRWQSNQHREDREAGSETYVTIAMRLVDVESGIVLFSSDGYFAKPARSTPEDAARFILRALSGRLAIKTGLIASGLTGFSWDVQRRGGEQVAVVTEFDPDSPARDAGLRSGDVILACNGRESTGWKTQWQAMKACQVEAGQTLSLRVLRGGQFMQINVVAKNRFVSSASSSK